MGVSAGSAFWYNLDVGQIAAPFLLKKVYIILYHEFDVFRTPPGSTAIDCDPLRSTAYLPRASRTVTPPARPATTLHSLDTDTRRHARSNSTQLTSPPLSMRFHRCTDTLRCCACAPFVFHLPRLRLGSPFPHNLNLVTAEFICWLL